MLLNITLVGGSLLRFSILTSALYLASAALTANMALSIRSASVVSSMRLQASEILLGLRM